jgi:hypothetical protein
MKEQINPATTPIAIYGHDFIFHFFAERLMCAHRRD